MTEKKVPTADDLAQKVLDLIGGLADRVAMLEGAVEVLGIKVDILAGFSPDFNWSFKKAMKERK